MSKYKTFVFESYSFDNKTGVLELRYSLDNKLRFKEVFRFDFPFVQYDPAVLDRALQQLFFVAGVSYYKTYLPSEITIKSGQVDAQTAAFLGETYQKGLGEFFYVNKLDPQTPVVFPVNSPSLAPLPINPPSKGLLIGVGGGKDSLVTIELIRRSLKDVMTWSLNHRPQLQPLVDEIGLPHAWVERTWDPQLLTIKEQGAYNGHVPISAIFAATGTIVSILAGKRDAIVSNEQSANEPTLHYQGVDINHQYSKSQEFEESFQNHLRHLFDNSLRYYSFLRPLSEVYISEIFSHIAFEKYKNVFSSCNRAFVHGGNHMFWCGECPKCAFVFLALTPFITRKELESLWGGKNLLFDESLEPTYRQLLGIEGDKPLECVGEVKESRAAMRLTTKTYPDLSSKYEFSLPEDYDYKRLYRHSMPRDMFDLLKSQLETL